MAERCFSSSTVIEHGRSFGFEIGQTQQNVLEIATTLVLNGKADVVQIWPDGEASRPILDGEELPKDGGALLRIVVDSEWWNNSIVLCL